MFNCLFLHIIFIFSKTLLISQTQTQTKPVQCHLDCVYIIISPLFFFLYFPYRFIRSTVSVCVTLTAAAAPPPPAPTVHWKTQACVPTTATTVAAKLATQQPTDRCRQEEPTHEILALTHTHIHINTMQTIQKSPKVYFLLKDKRSLSIKIFITAFRAHGVFF